MPEAPGPSSLWSLESLKSLGLPTVLCCAMLWIGKGEVEKASARLDKLFDFIMNKQLEQSERQIEQAERQVEEGKKSTAALENNTEVLKAIREDARQRETMRKHGSTPIAATTDGGGA